MNKPISHSQIQTTVSADQYKAFNRDGFLRLRNVLTPEIIQSLRATVNTQLSEWGTSPSAYDFQDLARQMWRGDTQFTVNGATRFDMNFFHAAVTDDETARPFYDQPVSQRVPKGKFFYDAAGWRRFASIREVAMDTELPEIAASLLDSTYIHFWEDTTFIKTAGATQRTVFHQDKAYFQISGNKCCIVWIPIDTADEETGSIEYVRGSHNWGRVYAPNVFFTQTPFPHSDAPKLPDIEGNRYEYDIVRVDAEPGDVVIHHVLTVHGAGGNRSTNRDRRAISLRYCGDDIRYFDRPGAIPQIGLKGSHNDGDDLYSCDYPLVFPRPFPGAKLSRLYTTD